MPLQHAAGEDAHPRPARWLGVSALCGIAVSLALMMFVSLEGRSAAVPRLGRLPGWPPFPGHGRPSTVAVSAEIWSAALLGGVAVAAGLLAVRRGWRPSPRPLLAGAVVAAVALMLVPPVGSADMFDYAAYGRIAALGHNPYVMTPQQLRQSGDPVGKFAPIPWQNDPSVYGPLATGTEWAASELAGPSAPRTTFWLKVLNALAFLAVALALGWAFRGDPAGQARAHLLWSVNPLMLFAVMAGGHIDGLAAVFGVGSLLVLRKTGWARGLLAGLLAGIAIAIKSPFVLFLPGLGWAARRSGWTLAAIGAGVLAVVVPSYLIAGPKALSAVIHRANGHGDVYQPWQLLTRAAGLPPSDHLLDTGALVVTVALALVLLWRMPPGPARFAGIRPALAVSLAWLACSPQQRPWYDAMIFPLLALMPATRLDWIALVRLCVATIAELPGVTFYVYLRPHWLHVTNRVIDQWAVPSVLLLTILALLWLCLTGRWTPGAGQDLVTAGTEGAKGAGVPPDTAGLPEFGMT